jgi:hypothetical protein
LKYLNKCQRKKDKEYSFSFPRDRADQFLTVFFQRSRKLAEFPLDEEAAEQLRNSHFYEILLGISNDKIDLGSYATFSEGIVNELIVKVRKKLKATKTSPRVLSNRVQAIQKFIEDITKISHILIDIVLSIYKEHDQDLLTEKKVPVILNFLRELWLRLEQGIRFGGECWEIQVHKVLKADNHFGFRLAAKREARY